MLLFKNVRVLRSEGIFEEDVYVRDGMIVEPFDEAGARVIDGQGKLLMAGAIDAHVHFREPGAAHKETWETGSAAAAFGGVTTVLDMPNNTPPVTTRAALRAKHDLVRGRSYVNYGFHFGAVGGQVEELRALEGGVVGVKLYMCSSTGNLLEDDANVWRDVFEACKEKGLPVVVHGENEERIRERMRERLDRADARVHAEIRDCNCAKMAVGEALALQAQVGNQLHIAHMSCGRELEMIQAQNDARVSCEVAPHHLWFSEEDIQDAFLKMNPPLRHKEDLVTLWEGVRSGGVNCIATDHAPHTLEEKQRRHWDAPAGVPGVGFMLPLMLTAVAEGRLSLERVAELLCEAPARIFALKGKGRVEPGYDADLVLVDLEQTRTVQRSDVRSKCGWSPYEGLELTGWPVMTVVKGQVVVEKGELVSGPCGELI